MRVLVAGGVGFIGSWLCKELLDRGDQVISVDNYITGSRAHVRELERHPGFLALRHDVCEPFDAPDPLDAIVNLATPTSPTDCARLPLETLRVAAHGTDNLLQMAEITGARYVHATVVEAFSPTAGAAPGIGEPIAGASPLPAAVLQSAHAYGDNLVQAFHHDRGVRASWVRLHHAYGPRMRPDDGRLVTVLCATALAGEPQRVAGDGTQIHGFCFVGDLVRGLAEALRSEHAGPFELGDPTGTPVIEVARLVARLAGSAAAPEPDGSTAPAAGQPADTARAREVLGWEPATSLEDGLRQTLAHLRATRDE